MNEIKTCKCDSCGTTHPGVEFHSNGSPVLQLCKACDPTNFEAQARTDIDAWLNGGNPSLFFGRERAR